MTFCNMIQPSQKKFRGILFDFDGVLAETMDDHFKAWNEAFKTFNTHIAAEDFFCLEGMPITKMAEEMCRMKGIDLIHTKTILEQKAVHYSANHSFHLYPGVEDVITELHTRNIPIAIVSGGGQARIRNSAPADFLKKFTAIITAESTPRGKPFPDPYLEGARALGLSPSECIVVENAPLGIQAAKAAGAYCVAVTSTVSQDKLYAADAIITTIQKIRTLPIVQGLINTV